MAANLYTIEAQNHENQYVVTDAPKLPTKVHGMTHDNTQREKRNLFAGTKWKVEYHRVFMVHKVYGNRNCMDFEHRKLVAGEIPSPYAREEATREKSGVGSGGGGGGRTNAHDNFAKGLFVQSCPASCVLRASCERPVCVLCASCVRVDENSHNSV